MLTNTTIRDTLEPRIDARFLDSCGQPLTTGKGRNMQNWDKFSTPDLVIIRDATQAKANLLEERTPSRNPDVNAAFQRSEDALIQQVADIQAVIDSRGLPAGRNGR